MQENRYDRMLLCSAYSHENVYNDFTALLISANIVIEESKDFHNIRR